MAKQLTIRGVPDEVAQHLDRLSHASGRSVNAVVNEILADAVGENARRRRLERYVTWSVDEEAAFSRSLKELRRIDEELWD